MKDHTRKDTVPARVQDAGSLPRKVEQPVFPPRAYLTQYYEGLNPGNQVLLRFYARAYEDLEGSSFLEFSGGPTIYSLITAARTASWIHFCDYNAESLSEVKNWLKGESSAFDWTRYTRFALECETGGREPSEEDIRERERLIRQKVRKISRCDIFADDPLLGSSEGPYGVVAQTFVLDDLTQDKSEWVHLNRKLASLVKDGGLFVTVSLLNASYWTVQNTRYPAVTLTPDDITRMYAELGFRITSSVVEELEEEIGYDGFIMACGQRL